MTDNAAAWLVDRQVEAGNGRRVAVVCRGEEWTYDDLLVRVWRAQRALRELGVRRTERIALLVDDEPLFFAWFLGALRSGIVPVPMSTMGTLADVAAVVDDSVAEVVVVSPRHADKVTGTRATVVGWGPFEDGGEEPVAPTSADSPAFWLYSSGTTGRPKGVMHRHGAMAVTAATYARTVLGITGEDRCLSVAKLFFAYGLGNSLTFPLSVGATTILCPDPPTPGGMAALMQEHGPTLFGASPGFLAATLDAGVPVDAFATVRLVTSAGEALPADLHRRFTDHYGVPVLDGIGTTEALHIFLSNTVGAEEPGTSGTAVEGYELQLRDEHDRVVDGSGVPGFLHVKGASLATGYWSRVAESQAAFRGEWLRTGDVYVRTEHGRWSFLGRNNDMIKAGGIWVSPAEVESVLVEHPDVLEAAVVGATDDRGLELVVAYLVPRTGRSVDAASVEAHCRARMAAFKRPRRLVVVDALPKTATGKVRRFALRDALAAGSG